MDLSKVSDAIQAYFEKDTKQATTAAVIGTGAVLVAGVYFLTKSSGKKSKPAVFEIGGGNIAADDVKKAFVDYKDSYNEAPGGGALDKDQAPMLADTFYNLVTDFYEWGWGQSFHFSPPLPGKGWYASEVAHESRIAAICGLKPGMNCLDAGCGVGGPMRTIACTSGANVTGVTINAYQIQRAKYHNGRLGINLCDLVEADFLKMPFEDNHFDAAYAIEATCHAPTLELVFAEIFRVIKPGATFVSYEWLATDKFEASNAQHVKIMDDIIYGNSLPDMRNVAQALEAAKKAGFEVVDCRDLAFDVGAGHWYDRMAQVAAKAGIVNRFLVNVFSALRILPKGVKQVHDMLLDAAASGLVAGGELGIFTPMQLIILKKPAE